MCLPRRPQVGYWVSPNSTTGIVTLCSTPATQRCLGWNSSTSAAECGVGYSPSSPACSSCAVGYYSRLSTCLPCPPSHSRARTAAFTLLGGIGLFLCVILFVRVATRGRGVSLVSTVFRGRDFIVWAAMTAQILAQVGRRAVNAPPVLAAFYSGLQVRVL